MANETELYDASTRFWAWFDRTAADAVQTDVGQQMVTAGYGVYHTGGYCLAWQRELPNGRYIWISDEDSGLGTDGIGGDFIACLYREGDPEAVACGTASALADILEIARGFEALT